jgi:hypothetical protein
MTTNEKGKVYKNNVVLLLYFFCLGFLTAGIGVSIIIGFLGGVLLGSFATFFIMVFTLSEMKK